MMKHKIVIPVGWPQPLKDIPPGHFVLENDINFLCFKSEYHHEDGRVMAFNIIGEYFVSSDDTILSIPVEMIETEV